MNGRDNISRTQFSMEDIGTMPSRDFPGLTMDQSYQLPNHIRLGAFKARNPASPAARLLGRGGSQVYTAPNLRGNPMKRQRALVADIAANGIREPVDVEIHGLLGDPVYEHGHHRYWAARDLGMTHMEADVRDYRGLEPE